MCATYYLSGLAAETDRLMTYYHIERAEKSWVNPNPGKRQQEIVFPGYEAMVIVQDEGKPRFAEFNWGFIPVWSDTRKVAFANFNARDDKVETSKVYGSAFKSKRCIVPANAFFEWDKNSPKGAKVRYRFSPDDDAPLSFAGLWSHWRTPDDEVKSFTIMTVGPMVDVEPLHDRSPLVLDRDGERAWLDPKTSLPDLRALLKTSTRRLRAEPSERTAKETAPEAETKTVPKPKKARTTKRKYPATSGLFDGDG